MNYLSFFFLFILFAQPALAFSTADSVDLKQQLFVKARAGHVSLSYRLARDKLFNEIYLRRDAAGFYIEEVYCDDKVYVRGPGSGIPDSRYMNTEHTWPQSKFNSEVDASYQKSDLHHLFPTFSRINSERGSFPFAEVTSERELLCDESEFGASIRSGRGHYFEPPDDHKGNVARAMFYFSVRYKIAIDPEQEYFFRRWHEADPVDFLERERNDLIHQYQGNRNPFIDRPELVQEIGDF